MRRALSFSVTVDEEDVRPWPALKPVEKLRALMIDEPEAVSEFDVVVVAEPRPRVSQAPTLSVPLLRTTALF